MRALPNNIYGTWKAMVCGALSFFLPLSAYVATLLPTVGGFGDTGKFQFTGKSLSIPHPSGFPVYLWITHLASYLPIGDLAYRTNLVSALCGALAAYFLFCILRRIPLSPAIALGASLAFAFSSTFWSVSLIAEAYSLNALFVAAVISLLWKWREGGSRWCLEAACVLYGLSLGNHLVVTVVFPAAVCWIIMARRKFVSEDRYAARAALFLSAAIVPYLWLYLRFGQATVYKEVQVGSLGEFVGFVFGNSFAAQRFPFTLGEFLRNAVPMYGSLLRSQYGVAGMAVGLAGFVRLWRRARDKAIFLSIVFACDLIIGLNGTSSEMPTYYVPSYLIFAVWIGCAFMPPGGRPAEERGGARLLAGLFLCAYALRLFYDHLPLVNLHDHTFYGDVTGRVLESVPPGSVILSPNYNWTEAYLYKLLGEDKRRGDDVRVLHYWEPGKMKEYLSGQSISPVFYAAPRREPGKTRVFLHVPSMRDPRIAELRSGGFDLRPVVENRSALARSLRTLPAGRLLLLSMRDEGIAILNDDSYDALSALGVRAPVSKGVLSGWGFAAILTGRNGKLAGPQVSRFKALRLSVRAGDRIPGTGIRAPADLLVESRGAGRGNLSRIAVAGKEVRGGRHGLNYAYVDARSGKVIGSGNVPPSELHAMRESFLFEVIGRTDPGTPSPPSP